MTSLHRVLITGVGSIGERHLRCFQATGRCELVFCEPISERRADVALRYGVPGYATWQEACESESVSAAVIASPAPFHIPTARELTERGIHLLIEKPLSLHLNGIAELTDSIQRHATCCAVAFVYRALPALRHMRDAVRCGSFGKVVQVQVQSGQHFPFYRPAYREIYYADPGQGGGLIQDMLPHFMNAVEWIVGPTTKVVVDAEHRVLSGVTVEDTANLLTRHGDVMANFTVNQHQFVNEAVITLLCQRGALRWELNGHRWLSASDPGGDWKTEESFTHERDDFYILQANAFLDHLEGKVDPLCSLTDGITTLKSTLAILRSRETGRWVTVE